MFSCHIVRKIIFFLVGQSSKREREREREREQTARTVPYEGDNFVNYKMDNFSLIFKTS